MLICGVLLIELIYGLTSIPLNWDYRRSKFIYFFFHLIKLWRRLEPVMHRVALMMLPISGILLP